jgi:uncharacterized damage-inducible protein DinB
LRLS